MAERVFGPTGSRRRRRFLFVPMLVVTAVALMFVAGAQAVHGEQFQLDGDVLASTTTTIGGVTQNVDWDSLINANGTVKSSLPSGFDAATFDKDFNNTGTTFLTNDTTTFATGSKDELAIADWQCNFDNNVNSKIDVMNAYAATYTDPVSGDEFIYFGIERNANTGTADVGFWFLKNPVGCESTGGAVDFQGAHTDGDLLIVSEFTGGGTVSTIKVFRWDGDDATGELNTTPVAEGVDCRDPLLPATDGACGAANRVAITTPWLTAAKTLTPKVGLNLPIAQFFEGGVNLTAADIEGCFTTYIADTRSSAETSATLFDYSSNTLGGCTTDVNTTPVDNGGTPIPAGGLTIPGDPADAAILVKDRAEIIVDGIDTFTATLTFHLCGPFPAGSSDLCGTGGVLVDTQNVTADGTFTSAAATVTAAGRYCWRADFSGDDALDVPSGSDSRASECFTVTPLQSALATQAGAGPVAFGLPVTDTATLTNTAHKKGTGGPAGSTDGSINPATLGGDATGTITFTLYKADCTTPATGTGQNPQSVNVLGDGTYGPVSFTPDAPGTYHWRATYSGDLPNTLGSSHNATCNDANETVVVQQIETDIKTRQSWFPNDTATVSAEGSGTLTAGGKVLFELFTNATCTGSSVFSQEVTLTTNNASEEVSTNNTTYRISTGYDDPANSTVGLHSWRVTYTPAASDTAHKGSRSVCNAERFNITYTNDPGPGIEFP